MRHRIRVVSTFMFGIFVAGIFPFIASASPENIKLPYEAGQRFVVAQGYNAPPTHIDKDLFALDLSQAGCDAYGKLAIAASAGEVMLAQENGYNGGYGTQVLVVNDNRIVARYAHLIPGTIPVSSGDGVVQGEPLGEIGNTGLVAGAACPTHPGTHLHFAMYGQQPNGSFSPFLGEPISGYADVTQGKWYLSDNVIALATIPGAVAIAEKTAGLVLGENVVNGGAAVEDPPSKSVVVSTSEAISQTEQAAPATNTAEASASATTTTTMPAIASTPVASATSTASATATVVASASGGVAASPPQDVLSTQLPATTTTTPASPPTPAASSSFNTSTLAIDLAWQPMQGASSTAAASDTIYTILKVDPANASNTVLAGETTSTNFSYPLSIVDFGTSPQFVIQAGIASRDDANDLGILSTIKTIPISLPEWFTETSIQSVDDTNSNPSWYSDNWYDLGAGFYGTVRSLTLEGFVDNSNYFASRLWLDEYLDPAYSQLNQSWTISDNAPFTSGAQKVTIGGLNIPLQPNKYYRLRTYQDYQNRSVVLAGTMATGTAMSDEFIYGTGRVEHPYTFYPYLAALMIPDYPPLQPPGAPAGMVISFGALNSVITMSWSAALDSDTTSSLLTYQWNITTSSALDAVALDPVAWRPAGKNFSASVPITFGNSYIVGVRAVDDLGNIGAAFIEAWHFPSGYVEVPEQIDHSAGVGGPQKIVLTATTSISGIALWTQPSPGDFSCCAQTFLSLHGDNGGSPGDELASTTLTIGRFDGPGERIYRFPAPVVLSAGTYWFIFGKGPSNFTNDTGFYGSTEGNAYFRIDQAVSLP